MPQFSKKKEVREYLKEADQIDRVLIYKKNQFYIIYEDEDITKPDMGIVVGEWVPSTKYVNFY